MLEVFIHVVHKDEGSGCKASGFGNVGCGVASGLKIIGFGLSGYGLFEPGSRISGFEVCGEPLMFGLWTWLCPVASQQRRFVELVKDWRL